MGCHRYVAWVAVIMLRYLGKQIQLPVLDWARSLKKDPLPLSREFDFTSVSEVSKFNFSTFSIFSCLNGICMLEKHINILVQAECM